MADSTDGKCRVLSLDPAGLLWGSERALLDFIGAIPGFEAACCCPSDTPLTRKLDEREIRCFPTFVANLHLKGTVARVYALCGLVTTMRRFRPAVLHVNQAGATRIALAACRTLRTPCVVHVRLKEDVAYLSRLKPSPRYLRYLIAISKPIADLLATQENLHKVPRLTLLDAYRPVLDRTEVDAALNSHRIKWDFVCVGRMATSKGQETLLRALVHLKEMGQRPKVAFVGEINAHGEHLRRVAEETGLGTTVEFLGHSDQVANILLQSKWLICPSAFEPLGRVLFEAWDCGLPVIAGAGAGGAAASVAASGGGLLFPEWTPESLANCISEAIKCDDRRYHSLAAAGRTWLVRATDPEAYANSIADVFRTAIHGFNARL
jgi:glycosyltransferase involved in cell wall biosynthesis